MGGLEADVPLDAEQGRRRLSIAEGACHFAMWPPNCAQEVFWFEPARSTS